MSGDQGGGEQQKKKRLAVIGVSSIMLVAMVVAVVVGVKDTHQKTESSDGGRGDISASTKAVQSMCQPTDYRRMCEKALSHANSSDPKELIKASFQAAMEKIEGALKNSNTIKAAKDDPRTAGALETCKEVMEYAVGDLRRSVNQMGEFELTKLDDYAENMRIWLSGAVTFQETCIDSFENTTGDAGEKMNKLLNTSRELTSNGLAMATQLTTLLQSLDIPGLGDMGRLLSENKEQVKREVVDPLPHWVDMSKRKLLQSPGSGVKADVVVAKDGSGKYKTVTEALKDVPVTEPTQVATSVNKTFVIYIKEGVYDEQVRVEANMMHVMFVGDGPTKTVITGKKSFADGIVVYKTATVAVMGSNFIAKDIGFENTAGPTKHQAVALLVQSDMSIFYNCHINGYKSTLYSHSYRQFYRDCTISGTIDFIFGDAAAIFQNSNLVIRKPLDDQQCFIAAHGRSDHKEATAFVLQNCTVLAHTDYYPVKEKNKAYLGRPWKKFSRTVFMQSSIDDSIAPEGWAPWMGTFGIDTCYFAEYENRGPGAATSGRVKWPGIKKVTAKELEEFTAGKFLGGEKWIVPSQVPFEPGMITI